MTTVRLICGQCARIERFLVTVFDPKIYGKTPPKCHSRPMLIAGEPKVDIHGLTRNGSLIDPVQNIMKRVLGDTRP